MDVGGLLGGTGGSGGGSGRKKYFDDKHQLYEKSGTGSSLLGEKEREFSVDMKFRPKLNKIGVGKNLNAVLLSAIQQTEKNLSLLPGVKLSTAKFYDGQGQHNRRIHFDRLGAGRISKEFSYSIQFCTGRTNEKGKPTTFTHACVEEPKPNFLQTGPDPCLALKIGDNGRVGYYVDGKLQYTSPGAMKEPWQVITHWGNAPNQVITDVTYITDDSDLSICPSGGKAIVPGEGTCNTVNNWFCVSAVTNCRGEMASILRLFNTFTALFNSHFEGNSNAEFFVDG